MQLSDVTQLVKLLEKTSLTEITFKDDKTELTLKKEPARLAGPMVAAPVAMAAPYALPAAPVAHAPASVPAENAASSKFKEITSPMVGTFFASSSPGAEAFIKVGSSVKPGQVLCIIEAMKIMNEIEADIAGEIVEVCVANETPVEYGTVLFRVQPA
jgi:acetyl-CoA carboxylase biotin carboxyl carrier protein